MMSHSAEEVYLGQTYCHKEASLDSITKARDLLARGLALELDFIAITDHNTIDGALVVKQLAEASDLPIKVIIGEEILTVEKNKDGSRIY